VATPKPPEEYTSAELAYLVGLRLDQFHNGIVDPVPYYKRALAIDPDYSRANVAMGVRLAKNGCFAEAKPYLEKAVARATQNHTRALDAAPEYYLALVERGLASFAKTATEADEHLKRAEDLFWRCTWRATCKKESDVEIARLAALRGDWTEALARIEDALALGQDDAKLWTMKGIFLRKLGGSQLAATVATKRLAAGETWRIEFGLDRAAFDTGARGRKFGALLRVTDVDGASKMRVDVPLVGTTSGESATSRTWPGGLWVADVAFNRIVAPGSSAETETGGTAKLRLPIHIDAAGKVRLLQRVVSAGEVAADGTYAYRLYAGTATVPTTANVAMRISAVCLPTELPVVESAGGTFSTNGVTFAFTVAGDGATSLLRHPLHPQHDGLRWDFKTPAPNGDDFANYKGDVKPETFSVQNEINLMFNLNGGEASWNAEQTKSGTCRWKLTNLMRQGPITLVGDMTIKRVSPQTELVLE
jgi:hypothetical protein